MEDEIRNHWFERFVYWVFPFIEEKEKNMALLMDPVSSDEESSEKPEVANSAGINEVVDGPLSSNNQRRDECLRL